jgi:protoheme IX farnesyltransferase
MSIASDTEAPPKRSSDGSTAFPSDYVVLLKPRVMSLVVLTALTGLMMAPGHVNPVLGVASLIAIAIGAGASGALNMWFDADIDALMRRTRNRPIPSGKIDAQEALTFGSILSVLSVFILGVVANWLAAALLAATILFYACVYTMWLKRSTPQNIVIGGAAGAMPPLIGCAAATGTVTEHSLVLFAIIFIWTPPHFWALALARTEDYAKAQIPMMPNVKGHERTRLEILVYSLILAPVGCLPWLLGFGGTLYGIVACAGGAIFLYRAWQTYRIRDAGPAGNKVAMRLFGFSILYLFALFTVLLIEQVAVLANIRWG